MLNSGIKNNRNNSAGWILTGSFLLVGNKCIDDLTKMKMKRESLTSPSFT